VYAIAVTGTVREFKKPELAHFKVRAVLDSGLWPRPDVELVPLLRATPTETRTQQKNLQISTLRLVIAVT
jgi:hypothetical protein